MEAKKWSVFLLILSLLCLCAFLSTNRFSPYVTADTKDTYASDTNISVIPLQLSRDTYGLAMVDSLNQNICIYKLNDRGTVQSRFQLYAARSFKYDRLLQQYNTDEPKPQQIKMMLENWSKKTDQEPIYKKEVKDANQGDEEQLIGW